MNILTKAPFLGLSVGILGIGMLFFELLISNEKNQIWSGDFDPVLLSWILEWGYHSIWVYADPKHFFDANSFFPHMNTLAYSDSLLSGQFFYTPLRIMGIEQYQAMYLTLALITIGGTMLTDYALKRIGGFSRAERVLIIFTSHFSLLVTTFLGHYQLFGFQLLPPLLLFLYLFIRDLRRIDILITFILFIFGACFAVYFAPMFVMVALCLSPFLGLKAYQKHRNSDKMKPAFVFLVIAGVITVGILYFFQFSAYFEVANTFPKQSYAESSVYSARPSSLLNAFSIHSYWHKPPGGGYAKNGDWERAIFPGYLLLFLSAVGISYLINKLFHRRELGSLETTIAPIYLYSLGIFSIALVFSLGPYLSSSSIINPPYYYLCEIFSGFRSIRAPGRFAMFLGLPIGILTVLGIRTLFTCKNLVWFFTLLVIVESMPVHKMYPLPYPNTDAYKEVASYLPQLAPIIDLPVVGKDHFDTLKRVMAQLNGSFLYRGRLVVGYGGKTTKEHDKLIGLDGMVQHHGASFDVIYDFANEIGVQYMLIRQDAYDESIRTNLNLWLNDKRESVILHSSSAVLIKIDKLSDL